MWNRYVNIMYRNLNILIQLLVFQVAISFNVLFLACFVVDYFVVVDVVLFTLCVFIYIYIYVFAVYVYVKEEKYTVSLLNDSTP